MQSHPLDGDGINTDLFKYLCRVSRSAISKGLNFKVPDTVIFSRCATFWYYFDKSTNSLSRRPAKDLDREEIYQFFAAKMKHEKTDIVAQFSSWTDEGLQADFLTRKDLRAFLFEKRQDRHGILQKFIEPKESFNDLVEVAWSPQMSFAVRRVNSHRIIDKAVPPNERCATFDGSSHTCEEKFCNSIVRTDMATKVRSLVEYSHQIESKFEIARCVAFFKTDVNDDTWFFYTTSVRVVEKLSSQVHLVSSSTTDASSGNKKLDNLIKPLPPRPELVPLMLTLQQPPGGDGSTNGGGSPRRNSSSNQRIVPPPPHRLRGDFFTCAAIEDTEAIEEASKRRRDQIDRKRRLREEDRHELFAQLEKLEKDATSLPCFKGRGFPGFKPKESQPFTPPSRADEGAAKDLFRSSSPAARRAQQREQYTSNKRSESRKHRRQSSADGSGHNGGQQLFSGRMHPKALSKEAQLAARLRQESNAQYVHATIKEEVSALRVALSDCFYPLADAVAEHRRAKSKNVGQQRAGRGALYQPQPAVGSSFPTASALPMPSIVEFDICVKVLELLRTYADKLEDLPIRFALMKVKTELGALGIEEVDEEGANDTQAKKKDDDKNELSLEDQFALTDFSSNIRHASVPTKRELEQQGKMPYLLNDAEDVIRSNGLFRLPSEASVRAALSKTEKQRETEAADPHVRTSCHARKASTASDFGAHTVKCCLMEPLPVVSAISQWTNIIVSRLEPTLQKEAQQALDAESASLKSLAAQEVREELLQVVMTRRQMKEAEPETTQVQERRNSSRQHDQDDAGKEDDQDPEEEEDYSYSFEDTHSPKKKDQEDEE